MVGGSLKVKLPTIWPDVKAEVGRIREEKRREESSRVESSRVEKKKDDQKKESLRRKKIQLHEKIGKSQNTVFFQ